MRLEFLDGELLYAMRVVTEGSFNLCPSEVCNPRDQASSPSFAPFPEVPKTAVETGQRIVEAAGIDVGAVEYLETPDGRRVFYDINANSNLRGPIGAAFGLDPFDEVARFLAEQVDELATRASSPAGQA